MTPAEYESLFAEIIKGIRSSDQRATDLPIASGIKNRIRGASGYRHQIDVSFGYGNKFYVVECKKWKSRVGVAEVLVLASRKQDIEAASPVTPISAIIVSQVGATRGASLLAKHFGIEISVAKSGHEYGLRLGQAVFLAVQDTATFSDSVSVAVSDK